MSVTTQERLEQRAKDPVSRALIRHLIVPSIYFDARWPDENCKVDLLAIDRAGTGGVHVVEIKRRTADALRQITRLLRIPAQFRWIAFFADTHTPQTELKLLNKECLYPAQDRAASG